MIYGEKEILIRGLSQNQNINEHYDTSPAQNIGGKTLWVEGCVVTSTYHRLFMYKKNGTPGVAWLHPCGDLAY